MKKFKKLFAVIAIVGTLSMAGAVYATEAKTPAEIVAGLTGKSIEALNQEQRAGKTYGTIAKDAGKLDEFKAQSLEQKKAVLDQRVTDGRITQEQADQIYNSIVNNQSTCDGTRTAAIGKNNGIGFGQGSGMANGQGKGSVKGAGQGKGTGMANGSGTGQGMGAGRGLNR